MATTIEELLAGINTTPTYMPTAGPEWAERIQPDPLPSKEDFIRELSKIASPLKDSITYVRGLPRGESATSEGIGSLMGPPSQPLATLKPTYDTRLGTDAVPTPTPVQLGGAGGIASPVGIPQLPNDYLQATGEAPPPEATQAAPPHIAIQTLMNKARTLEAQLQEIYRQIRELQGGYSPEGPRGG
jgi:hypothetical protein|tara:strand:- start:592 stop:1149 length:558 start_codon:yes stop_codon:yes gene_type:complete